MDPAWTVWNDATVPRIARGIYDEHAFDRLPILADALLDAGCDDEDLMAHLRAPGAARARLLGARPHPREIVAVIGLPDRPERDSLALPRIYEAPSYP